ncbi:murinoglobulin-1-like [Osmia bicornis bicornis]|uniref:murinoglobulin-1-like n=1 Tax=Osmia bicornis bicornis TaxID=1437191 RepID=UPI0010F85470|nr:murinoglobulin-1-like [Osmia bicornis bicornis]
MDKLLFLVTLCCLVGFIRCNLTSSNIERGYVFTIPNRLLAGETVSGCLSLHNLEPPAHVLLELLSQPSEQGVLSSTDTVLTTGIETCLELIIPTPQDATVFLRLTIKFEKHPEYVVNIMKMMEIQQNSLITFVETDKPIYKPGQDVNIRILMLKHDLKPWKKLISKVWIENPAEVRVAQWSNVSTENGMVQLAFPLSSEPRWGTWKIKVEKYSNPQLIHTTTFEVTKYVLPRFQISITSPKYVLADAENVTWNICVKYSYNKPVKGTLLLKLTPDIPHWRITYNVTEIRYKTEMDSPDGCTKFAISGSILNLPRWSVDPENIILLANFTEAGTGVVETMINWTPVKHEALKIEFAQYMPKYFKLDLPYHGKLRVLRQDNTPAPTEKIQLCLKVRRKHRLYHDVVECRDFTSSADGFIDFIVPPQHKNVILLSFVATAVDYPMKYYAPENRWKVFMNQPSAHINVNPWYSPSDSYLAVARGSQPIVCGEKYSFNVMYTIPPDTEVNESILFHYSINSKGDILIYGHVKHKPGRDTILNYSEFRNLLGSLESSENKTDQDPIVHRFPLSVKVTSSMAPISELLLYYVRSDGEIVATTYTIEVGHCFENKVKTAWHTDVQTPGSTTQYHVEAAPWSLCAISAIDKSTLFLGGLKSNLINAAQTFERLKMYHPTSDLRENWMQTNCKMSAPNEEFAHLPRPAVQRGLGWLRKRRSNTYHRSVDYVNAMQAFNDFGVVVMSNLVQKARPCSVGFSEHVYETNSMRMMTMDRTVIDSAVAAAAMDPGVEYVDEGFDQTPTLRSYFPETWLWELVPTGKEGKVTIERTLPDTITDWVSYTACISPIHGLGIAPPTTITAFQSFFLDYSLPYSVKRGEMFRMKVSLFNYMQHSLPVKIKLENISGVDLHLSHPTASFCVKPRDSVVHEYVLRPRVIGEVNITVSASVDTDYLDPCGPQTLVFTRDTIVKPILILPEGFPVEETKTMLVCPTDFNDDSTFMWEVRFPEDVVPDSGRAYVTLVGDVLGPALENLDKLVRVPTGCGEQTMLLFVPNFHVLRYLDVLEIKVPALRERAIKNMEEGYQKELTFRKPDGSYSSFSTSASSIWLTAFVLKSFAQARSYIHIDERDLEMTANWIVRKQLENGCFPVIGTVFHKQMKGALQDDGSSAALTAYIVISLLKSRVPLPASLISNSFRCLEKIMDNSNDDLYTTILTTYAVALSEHPFANASVQTLMDLATRYNGLIWWEDKTRPSMSLSIEMTSYVILTLVKLGGTENLLEALKAVRWLSKQRNAKGGFISTQDTILGLEALAEYAMTISTKNTDLSVLVTAKEIDVVHRLYNENRMLLKQIHLPVLPTIVEVFAEGKGCILVQTNIRYNVPHTTGSDAFDLTVAASSDAYANECSIQDITICARYKLADGESNMALIEIGMISGYVPDRESLQSLLQPTSRVKRFEEDNDMVSIYFDKLTSQRNCISFKIIRENVVDRLEPANVKLYDYYQQELMVSSSYKIASMCGSAEPIDEKPAKNLTFQLNAMRLPTKDVLNSSFVVMKYELDVPEGMEGPVPVYVKPNTIDYKMETTIATNGVPELTPTLGTEDQTVQWGEQEPVQEEFDSQIKNTTDIETDVWSPTGAEQFCPVCMDKIPSDIRDIYCSASSVVKVAIRRLRKARMLLDLHASREVQRLRATVEFTLSSNCSCSPLDTPGSLALIINKDNDFLASGDHKQTLNDSFYIYGLPPISGVPCTVAEARSTCSNEEKVQCT